MRTELLARQGPSRRTDDAALARQQAGSKQVKQSRQQLALARSPVAPNKTMT
jgi:hypothetical protein